MPPRSGPMVTFRGGSGNATVPDDAPIQPPQAWVNCIQQFILNYTLGHILDCSSSGITSVNWDPDAIIRTDIYSLWQQAASDDSPDSWDVRFQGNGLDETSVNTILHLTLRGGMDVTPGSIDLSGGTNAAPTGQGITDKATLILAGWTVTTN